MDSSRQIGDAVISVNRGYRMLSAKHGDIVYAERSIESSVKYDYSSPVRHMNKRPGFGDISVAIHDANEVATSIKLPAK